MKAVDVKQQQDDDGKLSVGGDLKGSWNLRKKNDSNNEDENRYFHCNGNGVAQVLIMSYHLS